MVSSFWQHIMHQFIICIPLAWDSQLLVLFFFRRECNKKWHFVMLLCSARLPILESCSNLTGTAEFFFCPTIHNLVYCIWISPSLLQPTCHASPCCINWTVSKSWSNWHHMFWFPIKQWSSEHQAWTLSSQYTSGCLVVSLLLIHTSKCP